MLCKAAPAGNPKDWIILKVAQKEREQLPPCCRIFWQIFEDTFLLVGEQQAKWVGYLYYNEKLVSQYYEGHRWTGREIDCKEEAGICTYRAQLGLKKNRK